MGVWRRTRGGIGSQGRIWLPAKPHQKDPGLAATAAAAALGDREITLVTVMSIPSITNGILMFASGMVRCCAVASPGPDAAHSTQVPAARVCVQRTKYRESEMRGRMRQRLLWSTGSGACQKIAQHTTRRRLGVLAASPVPSPSLVSPHLIAVFLMLAKPSISSSKHY